MTGPKTISAPKVSCNEFEELIGIRLKLEGRSAELAARYSNHWLFCELEKCHAKYCLHRASNNGKVLSTTNADFHFEPNSHANAPSLMRIIDSLWVPIGPILRLIPGDSSDNQDGT